MSRTVFLDESGDLGFKFGAPYLKGGSSRYLTMAYMIIPDADKHHVKRFVKKIYKKYKFDPADEVKGSSFSTEQKIEVAKEILKFVQSIKGVFIGSITVKKERVASHIRKDPNLLYNYMMKLGLIDKILPYDKVHLIRDNKSVKVASGNSLINYLQTTVFFEYTGTTEITDCPSDSRQVKGLMFIDWLNNIIWSHYENNNSDAFLALSPILKVQTLFF